MKIKIEEIQTKVINTKYGEKEKYRIKTSTGRWVGSWVKDWNRGWLAGMEVEADFETQGKYTDLVPPKQKVINDDFEQTIKAYFGSILTELQAIRRELNLTVSGEPMTNRVREKESPIPPAIDNPTDIPF